MKFRKKLSLFVLGSISLASCKGKFDFAKQKADDEKIIVQYGEHFLTDRDIRLILPKDYTVEDSISLVKTYIEEWVKKKAIVDKAEENIDELTLKEIENKIVEYRQDLLINAYNNYLIEKNIKDSITDEEIFAYYEKHKDSFPLVREVLQFRAVTVEKEDASLAERLFNSGRDEDFDEVMKLVLNSGNSYHDKDSIWYSPEYISAQFPLLSQQDYLNQLMNRRRVKMEEDEKVTMVRILNLKPKGSIAPYEFVKPTIKNLLLNKRKLNLLSDLQNQLYKEAINKNEIKINEN
jgi:hypothetical protein